MVLAMNALLFKLPQWLHTLIWKRFGWVLVKTVDKETGEALSYAWENRETYNRRWR